MRKRQIDKLLKAAIIEKAEEQGTLWEREPVLEPIPEESRCQGDDSPDNNRWRLKRVKKSDLQAVTIEVDFYAY